MREDFTGFRERGFERPVAVAHAEGFQHRRVREFSPGEIVEPGPVLGQRPRIKTRDAPEQIRRHVRRDGWRGSHCFLLQL